VKTTPVNIEVLEDVLKNYPNWSLYDENTNKIITYRHDNTHNSTSYDYLLDRLEALEAKGKYILKVPEYSHTDFAKLEGHEISAAYRHNSFIYSFIYGETKTENKPEITAPEPPKFNEKNGINVIALLQHQHQQNMYMMQMMQSNMDQRLQDKEERQEIERRAERDLHLQEIEMIKSQYDLDREEQQAIAGTGLNSLDRQDIIMLVNQGINALKGIFTKNSNLADTARAQSISGTQSAEMQKLEKIKKYMPDALDQLSELAELAENEPEKYNEIIAQQQQEYDEFTDE